MSDTRYPERDEHATKDGRIALRATREQRELIARASRAADTTVSDFVLSASLARAEDMLAEQRSFMLAPEQWDAFVARLDAADAGAAPDKPKLRALLAEP